MNPEETMVEEQFDDVPADDTPVEDVAETEADESESLESLNGDEGGAEANPQAEQSTGASEPGWIKQRVNKAVQKAVAETEARMRADFDRQMAPIRERMITEEARELVRQGEFKSLDRAKEYLQLKQGMPAAPEAQPQPRNNQGQFAPKDDPVVSARISILANQADKIKASRGIDVMAEFNSNAEIKSKVLSGDMDFYEVAEQMQTRKRPPAPTRSPNGASGKNPNAIDTMSDELFERMEKRIKEGARYTLK